MNKKTIKIKEFWDERARAFQSKAEATIVDPWIKKIELREVIKEIKNTQQKRNILEVGCGNGYSLIQLAKVFKNSNFIGFDYSEPMIEYANKEKDSLPLNLKKRIMFYVDDILELKREYKDIDFVITERCLINLTSFYLQRKAISNIAKILKSQGTYICIENFVEGRDKLNNLRKQIGLKEVSKRWHNLVFNEPQFVDAISKYFEISKFENITSLYYLATRVVYSKICALENREPDYDNIIYRVAIDLPVEGDYGPVKLVILKRK